jgi:ABC-type lipoprotein export system ATPase subunit
MSTPAAATTAFAAVNLEKTFRLDGHVIPVLRGVNLEICRGEWAAFIGASGSGKSTLLHLLAGLDDATAGEVLCLDRPYSTMSRSKKATLRRHEIGLVFQNFLLFPELTALENAALPALHWGWPRDERVSRARELLERFGLATRLDHRPQELSGGEQQRVALARALINDPAFILADEPTGNLDNQAAGEIITLLEQLHRDAGKTVIMVTHDLNLARKADRVWRIAHGVATEEQLS